MQKRLVFVFNLKLKSISNRFFSNIELGNNALFVINSESALIPKKKENENKITACR
jgi:hypothetical protein